MKQAYNKKEHDEVLQFEDEQKIEEEVEEEDEDEDGKKKKKKKDKMSMKKDEGSKMNLKTMKKILFYWGITLPTAFAFSAFLTWVLHFIK